MTKHLESDNRIEVLDGFRFLAIFSVLLYHYYSRWTTPISPVNLYPYGSQANFFRFGYLGVEFFFIISGFVITYSLHGNKGLVDFWKRRWIRLFPAMLICSLITYFVLIALDTKNLFPSGQQPANLFIGLTFISPSLINTLFKPLQPDLHYITGSYWSLWPEIQFYVVASLTYYFDPKKFYRNFFLIAVALYLVCRVTYNVEGNNIFHLPADNLFINYCLKFFSIFNLCQHLLWFLFGVIFFQLYSKQKERWTISGLVCITFFQLYDCKKWEIQLCFLIMMCLFIIFIYKPKFLNFLKYKVFTTVGVVSYSIYLIHENIGILLINKYGFLFAPYSVLFPLLIIGSIIVFAILLYRYFEKPIGNLLKNKFVERKNTIPVGKN